MSEINEPEVDIINRLRCLLRTANSEHEITETFSHCSTIVLWVVQLLEHGRNGSRHKKVRKELEELNFKGKFCLEPTENDAWNEKFPDEQIDPGNALITLKGVRNAFAHIGEHRVEPVNHSGKLKSFKLRLGGKGSNSPRDPQPTFPK